MFYEEINNQWSEYCLEKLIELGLSWNTISRNRDITWEIVQANPSKRWCYSGLSENPNITWEIVQANPDKRWSYIGLSYNPNITREIVKSNPDKDWSYRVLRETWSKPKSAFYKPSCMSVWLSLDPILTWEMVQANPRKCWDYYYLSMNRFTLEKEMFFRKKLPEWFKKSDLKRELIAKVWHPKNYEKFKYYDPDMFSDGDEEDK